MLYAGQHALDAGPQALDAGGALGAGQILQHLGGYIDAFAAIAADNVGHHSILAYGYTAAATALFTIFSIVYNIFLTIKSQLQHCR